MSNNANLFFLSTELIGGTGNLDMGKILFLDGELKLRWMKASMNV